MKIGKYRRRFLAIIKAASQRSCALLGRRLVTLVDESLIEKQASFGVKR